MGHAQNAVTRASAGGGDGMLLADPPVNRNGWTGYTAALCELADSNDVPLLFM